MDNEEKEKPNKPAKAKPTKKQPRSKSTTKRLSKQKLDKIQKSYSCDVCGKMFSNKGKLNNHCRFHVEERPFACDMCDIQFKTKSHLESHMLTNKHVLRQIHQGSPALSHVDTEKLSNQKGELADLRKKALVVPLVVLPCEACGLLIYHKDMEKHQETEHSSQEVQVLSDAGPSQSPSDQINTSNPESAAIGDGDIIATDEAMPESSKSTTREEAHVANKDQSTQTHTGNANPREIISSGQEMQTTEKDANDYTSDYFEGASDEEIDDAIGSNSESDNKHADNEVDINSDQPDDGRNYDEVMLTDIINRGDPYDIAEGHGSNEEANDNDPRSETDVLPVEVCSDNCDVENNEIQEIVGMDEYLSSNVNNNIISQGSNKPQVSYAPACSDGAREKVIQVIDEEELRPIKSEKRVESEIENRQVEGHGSLENPVYLDLNVDDFEDLDPADETFSEKLFSFLAS